MPRGNDTEGQRTALHELGDSFGDGTGNAEALINANAARSTADLATVSGFPVDEEASSDLDLDSVDLGDTEGYVMDAVVRRQGRSKGTIVLYQDDSGRLLKTLVDSNLDETRGLALPGADGPRKSSRAKASAEPKKLEEKA